MSEALKISGEEQIKEIDTVDFEKIVENIGHITILEALASPEIEVAPGMTWQSTWTNKEDK